VLAMLPLQLAFNAPVADFEARVFGPSMTGIEVLRPGTGLPASGAATNMVNYGERVELQSAVMGDCANTYQWWREEMPVTGATNATLVVSNTVPSLAGRYRVTVSNELGLATSPAMTLVVTPPVVRLEAPQIATNTFTATVSGLPVGMEFVLESSPDLQSWQPVVTNTPLTTNFFFSAPVGVGGSRQFYRAIVQ
jgi:hypothetical protein